METSVAAVPLQVAKSADLYQQHIVIQKVITTAIDHYQSATIALLKAPGEEDIVMKLTRSHNEIELRDEIERLKLILSRIDLLFVRGEPLTIRNLNVTELIKKVHNNDVRRLFRSMALKELDEAA